MSFCIGVAAMYVAFFLYEDQEKQVQNSLEDMWVRIHDRALHRGSTAVALLNSAGSKMNGLMNRLFGKPLVSIRSAITSINLSALGALTFTVCISLFKTQIYTVICVVLFGYASFRSGSPRKIDEIIRILTAGMYLVIAFSGAIMVNDVSDHWHERAVSGAIFLTLFSFLSDLGVIVLVRRLGRFLANEISVVRLFVVFPILAVIPCSVFSTLIWGKHYSHGRANFLIALAALNIDTALFCLMPIAVVIGLLAHLAVWPVLSRILYPLPRHGVVGSRKSLAAIGVLALSFAFNIEQVGVKALLKIFA